MLSHLSKFSDNEIEIKIFTLKDTVCNDSYNQSSSYPYGRKIEKKNRLHIQPI